MRWLPPAKTKKKWGKTLSEDAILQDGRHGHGVHSVVAKLSSDSEESEDNDDNFAITLGHCEMSSCTAGEEVSNYLQNYDKSIACLKTYSIIRCPFLGTIRHCHQVLPIQPWGPTLSPHGANA